MTETIIEKCRQHNIPRSTFYWRITHGWTEEDALTRPPATKHNYRLKKVTQ